jgi:hypothetical protein
MKAAEPTYRFEQRFMIPSELWPILYLPDINAMFSGCCHAANLSFCGENSKYSPQICGE